MSDREYLEDVTEDRRSDGTYYITSAAMGSNYIFSDFRESLMIPFNNVSTYIEWGSEWADFYIKGSSTTTICNEDSDQWPHWIFEEFSYIETDDELRPIDEYETAYFPSMNRGM